MNVLRLFSASAKTMLAEFEQSAHYSHEGTNGSVEDILKNFLRDRIPARFGVGAGQIIGPSIPDSRQTDVILYDTNICAPIIVDASAQIYPVEGVSGIIEVKSRLSKADLCDGLEKIVDFKRLVPRDYVSVRWGMQEWSLPRERPFGIVFAYSTADNSLESLREDLCEFEASLEDRSLTANLVVVLDRGVILHKSLATFKDVLVSDALEQQRCEAICVRYGRATLFEFYTMLLHLLINTQLEVVDFNRYRRPVERLGEHIVRGHDRLFQVVDAQRDRLTAQFIDAVVKWCEGRRKLSSNELNRLILPGIPAVRGRVSSDGPPVIYLYNPDDLPGVTVEAIEGAVGGVLREPALIGTFFIEIDAETYAIPECYTTGNTEASPGATTDDPWSR